MGITLLYPTEEKEQDIDLNASLSLDIIAIHGLGGNPMATWTDPKSQKLWLRDLLPHDIPRARIMTFGYDATPAFENSVAGVEDHARDLLRCLRERRERVKEINRPIIFIGHSLGGIVIKQALIISSNSPDYIPLCKSTIGTLFFGTPHRGSALASHGARLARIPTALALKPASQLLLTLSQDSLQLNELMEKYKQLMDERPYDVVSFYETKAMTGFRKPVVTKESAILSSPSKICHWETPIPVPANHRAICWFSSSKNDTYQTAMRRIQRIRQDRTTAQVKNEYYTLPHMVNSHFTGRNDIRRRLNDSLLPEIYGGEREQSRFVLYGLGGSGKTQICLKFAQDYRDRFWGVFWIDASSTLTVDESFFSIARACKISPHMESVKEFLSQKEHWLLIIDNADDPEIDISKFFPRGTKGTMLITTRNPDFEKHATVGSYHVDQMEPEDAVALLLKTSALEKMEDNQEMKSARTVTAEKVVETLGYLAIAIIQAGAVIRQRTVSLNGFCELYSKQKKELLESGRPDSSIDDNRSVYTTWEISLRMIEKIGEKHSHLALELLRHFAFMHFTGICESIFEQACNNIKVVMENMEYQTTPLVEMMPSGWDQLLMGQALRLLASFSLVTIDDYGIISMHPLVHQWTRDRMSVNERDQTWKTVVRTMSMSSNFDGGVVQRRARKILLPHIDACLSEGDDRLFVDGIDLLHRLHAAVVFGQAYRENKRPGTLDFTQKTFQGIERHFPPGNMYHFCIMRGLAEDLERLGRYVESVKIREKVLQILRKYFESPDSILQNTTLCALTYTYIEKHQEAIEMCEGAMAEFSDVLGEDNITMIESLEMIGMIKGVMSRPKEAQKDLEKAWNLRKKKFGDGIGSIEISPSGMLAEVYIALKQPKKARMVYELHINLAKEIYGPNDLGTVKAIARMEDLVVWKPYRTVRFARRRAKGIASIEEATREYRNHKGETSVLALECMEALAWDYYISGWHEKGILLQEEVVRRSVQQWGKESSTSTRAVSTLKRMRMWLAIRNVCYWWVPKSLLDKARLRI
ncbi:uncharacterized protein BP5553_02577 [Venustampulla echinocandica]|uniref:NB-ARC domain-containing protein n=1 Tax=Venustampulla echinocandica TaxID=2656787 RepID=A0A370TRS6_9HELO|nr:uncharacterized protein BP5553_02577 [Venustampulla echinocandica]RDL38237.1 hypothetical protein BP5553_02577 [Venustampulla echinocandica]